MTSAREELMLGGASLVVFLIIWFLVATSLTQAIDAQLARAINGFGVGPLNSLMVVAAEYGREYFWIPLLVVIFSLGNRETKFLALELALLFIVGIVAGEAMKVAFFRSRPFEAILGIAPRVPPSTDSSFPSGHALIVSIGAVFAILRFKSRILSLLLAIEAAIVCYSRVYVGMHYPLDVVSGVFLGAGITAFGLFLVEGYAMPQVKAVTDLLARLLREGPLDLSVKDTKRPREKMV